MKGPPLYDPTPFGNDRTGNRRYALYPAGGGINEIPPAFDKRAGRDGFVSLKGRMGDFLRALDEAPPPAEEEVAIDPGAPDGITLPPGRQAAE